ncbi:MAG: ribulokinase [Planctomycetes bacterium]|nr:ribulokinase [Planctomycetota bacterium]
MSERLSLGLDFGTESVRALLLDLVDGRERAVASEPFAHGVMDEVFLPSGERLPPHFALQHPRDYIEAAGRATRRALESAGVDPSAVLGIGIDFTACTPLPLDRRGEPLCFDPAFEREPHAYVKLWKHHGAIPEAERMNAVARERGESFLARYGGTLSSEWLLPKLLELLRAAPKVAAAAARFVESSDWLVERWTGQRLRGACAAGYKGLVDAEGEHPSSSYLAAVDPRLPSELARLVPADPLVPAGVEAGVLGERGAAELGLRRGIPVSGPIIDAHAAVPGCGVGRAGTLVAILGTSACHMLLGEREVAVTGIQGVVQDGILPGFFGYEAGQAGFGDLFGWFVERLLGREDAAFADLERRASALPAGRHGLLALDWWNGNRSILIDPELSGLIVGLDLSTTREQIYAALVEAAAFGTRRILENFEQHGLRCDEVRACGGIAVRSPFVVQTLADITARTWTVIEAPETCARGAALCGAVAAGSARGGFDSMAAALRSLPEPPQRRVTPRVETRAIYDQLYALWRELHDHFGLRAKHLMHALRQVRREA